MKRKLAVLHAGWKRGGLSLRYFLATHVIANLLTFGLSIASLYAIMLDRPDLQLQFLAAAGLCAGQSLYSWSILRSRYGLS